MPVFQLSEKSIFPPAYLARFDGLLCVGGDLSPARLLLAYKNGIFPWFSNNEPILWWCPDPRLVLYPENFKISKSLKKKIRKNYFKITMDKAFQDIIYACAQTRVKKNQDTWITNNMIKAYIKLYKKGYAHSVEIWEHKELIGGLYGISLGGCFFGESMFSKVSDASKIAIAALNTHIKKLKFDFIDCQIPTNHMLSLGAVKVPRNIFLDQIKLSLKKKNHKGIWEFSGFEDKIINDNCGVDYKFNSNIRQ
ncbi:MAG: leucyl/phenylalanyl-tRNA--protein transferase [Desulfobacteraceae bacterium 4572_130]|nr:MAG: leucyl/phenylalanyl-tRNA--protein transferase [Desulfobacteraceae bacterium 4572_130]